jgi:hypothetical protein
MYKYNPYVRLRTIVVNLPSQALGFKRAAHRISLLGDVTMEKKD